MIVVALALAGGFGAVARAVLDGVVTARVADQRSWPWSTTLINLTGSLALGLIVGLSSRLLPEAWQTILGIGFLGGYTTFSTAAVQAAEMGLEGPWRKAAGYGLGLLAVSCVFAGVGMWTGAMV